ncbi:MAG TPA: carbohydrate kinase family protein, partial [Solirubrobacteraceae bacterium]
MSSAGPTIIGGVQVDVVMLPVAQLPAPGQTQLVEQMSFRSGGAAANAALALASSGRPARLIGCVAEDDLGRWLIEDLSRSGLGEGIIVLDGHTTGLTVACEAPGRDRSFITFLGVNTVWALEHMPADVASCASLLVCDYFCAPSLRGAPTRELMLRARAQGARTFFDTAWDPSGWARETREEVLGLLDVVDVFLPNEAEASALLGLDAPAEQLARQLQHISGGWVVVKMGARGARAAGPDGAQLSVAAQPVEVLDSTGAGDAFNAGLIAALCDGADWPEALESGTRLAASVLSRRRRE